MGAAPLLILRSPDHGHAQRYKAPNFFNLSRSTSWKIPLLLTAHGLTGAFPASLLQARASVRRFPSAIQTPRSCPDQAYSRVPLSGGACPPPVFLLPLSGCSLPFGVGA